MRLLGPATAFAAEVRAAMTAQAPFSALSREEADELCALMTVHEAEPGATLFQEGDPPDFMLLIVEGAVDVLRLNRNEFPARLAVAGAGEAVGEMSLFDGAPRFSSCVALETTRVAVLTRAALATLLDRDPALGAKLLLHWARLLSERLRDAGARLFAQLEAARSA